MIDTPTPELEHALNPAQREAVDHVHGPLLVLAGAGSGKTRVLTTRIAHLIDRHGVPPDRIFAVTFTNKAAGEMKQRIGRLLGRDPSGLWIGTFHSLSARLLRREAELLGFGRQFTIYDEDDRLSLIKRLMDQRGHSTKLFPPRAVQSLISAAKNRMMPPSELAAGVSQFDRLAAGVGRRLRAPWARRSRRRTRWTSTTCCCIRSRCSGSIPDRLRAYQAKFSFILVDEFQDTNRAQYELIRLLGAHGNVCAVGDDDQSIYGWRGADVRNMQDFLKDFPGRPAGPAGGELPLHPGGARRRQRGHRREQRPHREDAHHPAAGRRAGHAPRRGRRARRGRVGRARARAPERRRRLGLRRHGRALPHQLAVARAGGGVPARGHPVPPDRRDQLLRAARGEGPAGLPPADRQPADDEAFLRAVAVPRRGLGETSLAVARADGRALGQAAARHRRARPTGITDLRPNVREAFRAFAAFIDGLAERARQLPPAEVLEQVIRAIDYEAVLLRRGARRRRPVGERARARGQRRQLVRGGDATTRTGTPLERFLAEAALLSVRRHGRRATRTASR